VDQNSFASIKSLRRCFFTSEIIPSYAYTYIKIDYLKPLIIDDDTLQKLKRISDIDDFMESIRPYYPNLDFKENTIEDIEVALKNNYIKLIGKILHYSPNMRIFLRNYLMKFEIQNLKQIIISLILGINQEEKRTRINFLVEEYLDNTEFIEELLRFTSLDEIQLFLKRTKYNMAIREGILYFKKNKEIFILEAFLDQLYYKQLNVHLANLNKKEKTMISLFVKYKTEIYNINMIYRGIKNNIDRKLLSQFLVNHYLFLNESKLEYLLNLDSLDEFISVIEEYLKNIKEIKPFFIRLRINQKHLIRSIEQFYITYYFKNFEIKIDDIDFFTIYKILQNSPLQV